MVGDVAVFRRLQRRHLVSMLTLELSQVGTVLPHLCPCAAAPPA
jgi:hypothetical protein